MFISLTENKIIYNFDLTSIFVYTYLNKKNNKYVPIVVSNNLFLKKKNFFFKLFWKKKIQIFLQFNKFYKFFYL